MQKPSQTHVYSKARFSDVNHEATSKIAIEMLQKEYRSHLEHRIEQFKSLFEAERTFLMQKPSQTHVYSKARFSDVNHEATSKIAIEMLQKEYRSHLEHRIEQFKSLFEVERAFLMQKPSYKHVYSKSRFSMFVAQRFLKQLLN